ncbi:MAG: Ig-like domain-containing protein, partial [Gemmatimonadales bacterium]|nr:Ig-like domain-containing protein [Gemmatimonadales bacterium]
MRRGFRFIGFVLAVTGCGSSSPTPPPPTVTVATVEVTPPSAGLGVPGSVQLSAVPRDASGNALAGRAISWSTSSTAVATVSATGLVTSVGEGVATITATVEGKSSSAVITVDVTQGGPLLARTEIGPAGGTVQHTDVAVTIPAGALSTPRTLSLVRDTLTTTDYGANQATGTYRIEGLPAGLTVQTRVRIRRTQAMAGNGAIAMGAPAMAFEDSDTIVVGFRFFAAIDSSGYLVANVPITGKPEAWAVPGMLRALGDPKDLRAAAELTGLINTVHKISAQGHFEVWGFGGGPQLPEVNRKIDKVMPLAEQAYDKVASMGYSYDHRNVWPIEVYLIPATWKGCYYSPLPFPTDPDKGYIAYNSNLVDDANFPGTVIHEFFHFTQAGFTKGKPWDPAVFETRWFGEATATWIAGLHPAAPAIFTNPTALSWRDSLFSGLDRWLVPNSGYGKAPTIKYIVDRLGADKVRQIWTDIRTGA